MNANASDFEVDDLHAGYGAVRVLRGVSFSLRAGSVTALLGPNGAGKSTIARAVSGMIPVVSGTVRVDAQDVTNWSSSKLSRLGLTHVPDSRAVFGSLTVDENLEVGLRRAVVPGDLEGAVNRAYELFPALARRRGSHARNLSGGEQQMLALARVLVAPPRVLIVDELSHGLAPIIVESLFTRLVELRERTTILLIEQFVDRALQVASDVLVLDDGDLAYQGPAGEISREEIAAVYLRAGSTST